MMEVELGNVTEAIANLTERGAIDPVVKATLTLSESGFISVSDAVAYGEIKDESITGKGTQYRRVNGMLTNIRCFQAS